MKYERIEDGQTQLNPEPVGKSRLEDAKLCLILNQMKKELTLILQKHNVIKVI